MLSFEAIENIEADKVQKMMAVIDVSVVVAFFLFFCWFLKRFG